MKNIAVTVILTLLFSVLMEAQTIYHYKKVACVNPNTGVKEQYYGKEYLHIIYERNSALLVSEKGEGKRNSIPEDTYQMSYTGIGTDGKFELESRENGFNVYHCYHGYRSIHKTSNPYGGIYSWRAGDSSDHITTDDYLYISEDRRKINTRFKKLIFVPKTEVGVGGILYQGGSYEKRYGDIDVYELYDTDEKSSMPSTKSTDPAHPTAMY